MAQRPPWLGAALSHHLAGRFAEAERIYNDVLRANPIEPDALNLLGLIAAYRGQYDPAQRLIGRAIATKPGRGDFHAGLGNVFLAQGSEGPMVECYRRALLLAYFREIPVSFAELAAHAGGESALAHGFTDIGLYKSQCLQDVFLDRWVFAGRKSGVFIDVGAHDGLTFSNSCFFEQGRGWSGVCIEPHPAAFKQLAANRRCAALNCCVAANTGSVSFRKISGYSEMLSGIVDTYHPEHRERIERELKQFGGSSELITVEARTINELAAEHGLSDITYLSIDTEGSELVILQSMDFKHLFVHAITVECNFDEIKTQMVSLMAGNGFDFARTLTHDLLFLNRASPYHAAHARLAQGSR